MGVQETAEERAGMIGATHFLADGLKQLQAGAFQDALTALSIAIQLDPECGEAYAYRGIAHYQLGDYDRFRFSASTALGEQRVAQSGSQGKVAPVLPPGSLTSARSVELLQCPRNRSLSG